MSTQEVDRVWKPTPRQEEFLSLPDSIFEGLYGGAAGGGKSETLMMLPICRGFLQYSRFKGILFRRTYPELEKELILRSHAYYPDAGGKYNDQKKRWQFPSGAVIQFGYAEYEQDVRKYDTTEYNYMAFDEATSFTEFMYMYLTFSRVRSSDANLPAFVRSGTNPGNIGHNFFRTRFIDPQKEGGAVLRETRVVDGEERTFLRIFIKSLVQDNEHVLKNSPQYQYNLSLLPEAERAAKLYGDWYTFKGQVFDDFRDNKDRKKFSDEPDNAIHVIPPFPIPNYWPKVLSVDWGYAAMNICGFYAINPCPSERYPALIYKYRELARQETKISVWAKELKEVIQYNDEEFIDSVLDPSAWGHRGEDQTLSEQIIEHSGVPFRKANNDRVSGKMLIQEMLRWRTRGDYRDKEMEPYSSEIAARISRIQGPKALQSYNDSFIPKKADKFLPKFQIFNTCAETVKTIPVCVYSEKNPEDVAEFTGDDPYDETRYGLQAAQNYLEHGKLQHAKVELEAKIEDDLQRTGNYTQYFIRAASIKKYLNRQVGSHSVSAPVKRRIRRVGR